MYSVVYQRLIQKNPSTANTSLGIIIKFEKMNVASLSMN